MKAQSFLFPLALLVALPVFAAPQTFDFNDPKKINNVLFKLDAPLEAVNGTATGISGKVDFDPADPGSVKGKLVLATSSLNVPNPLMKDHLHSANWLDVKQFPEITFETLRAADVKTTDNVTTVNVTGKLTVKGVTKEVTVPVKLTYLKDKLRARGGPRPQDGDLLVMRTNFKIKRSDYGIQAGQSEDKVSDEIDLSLAVAGASPR